MDLNLLATHFSDITWILVALTFGILVTFISLPPMVGYLIAGFVLSGMHIQSGETVPASFSPLVARQVKSWENHPPSSLTSRLTHVFSLRANPWLHKPHFHHMKSIT